MRTILFKTKRFRSIFEQALILYIQSFNNFRKEDSANITNSDYQHITKIKKLYNIMQNKDTFKINNKQAGILMGFTDMLYHKYHHPVIRQALLQTIKAYNYTASQKQLKWIQKINREKGFEI